MMPRRHPEWHRERPNSLRNNGFTKMAQQHEQIAHMIERRRGTAGETMEAAYLSCLGWICRCCWTTGRTYMRRPLSRTFFGLAKKVLRGDGDSAALMARQTPPAGRSRWSSPVSRSRCAEGAG